MKFKKNDKIECFFGGVWRPGIFKEYSTIGGTFCTILCKYFRDGQELLYIKNVRRYRIRKYRVTN